MEINQNDQSSDEEDLQFSRRERKCFSFFRIWVIFVVFLYSHSTDGLVGYSHRVCETSFIDLGEWTETSLKISVLTKL